MRAQRRSVRRAVQRLLAGREAARARRTARPCCAPRRRTAPPGRRRWSRTPSSCARRRCRGRRGRRGRGSAGWSTRSRRSTGSSRRPAGPARGRPRASHMIETKLAERIGYRAHPLGRATSLGAGAGLAARACSSGGRAPSVHTTLLASTAGRRRAARVGVRRPGADERLGGGRASGWCRRRAARPGRARGVERLLDPDREAARAAGVAGQAYDVEVVVRRQQLGGAVGGGVVDDDDRRRRVASARAGRRAPRSSSSRRFQVTTTATTRGATESAVGLGARPAAYGAAQQTDDEVVGLVGGVPLLDVAERAATVGGARLDDRLLSSWPTPSSCPRRCRSRSSPRTWILAMSGWPVEIIGGTKETVRTGCAARLEGELHEACRPRSAGGRW